MLIFSINPIMFLTVKFPSSTESSLESGIVFNDHAYCFSFELEKFHNLVFFFFF